MIRNRRWVNVMVGAGLGYLVIHPLIMTTADLMHSTAGIADYWTTGQVISIVKQAFTVDMLPWGLGFGVLCAAVGWLLAKVGQAAADEQKLQGVLELAGATCHEMNQPMQVVLGYSELIRKELPPGDPMGGKLHEIIVQIEKMDRILKKIRAIARYESMDYLDGIKIIDIEKASRS
jgi:signal transduction histidine kinase